MTPQKHTATAQQKTPRINPTFRNPKQKTDLSFASPHEDNFWNTTATAARTLRFSDNLMDENVDLGDVTTTSFISPLLSPPPTGTQDNSILDDSSFQVIPELPVQLDSTLAFHDDSYNYRDSENEEELDKGDTIDADEEEKTIVIKKPSWIDPWPDHQDAKSDTFISTTNPGETSDTKEAKIRINSEIERIVVRILFDQRLFRCFLVAHILT